MNADLLKSPMDANKRRLKRADFYALPCLENQTITVSGDLNPVARLEFAFEQAHRKRVEDSFLHGAFERAGTELRVVALTTA
jgi:hypothetical protein